MEPEKAHPTSEFVIVTKFGDHVLHRLASSLSNVIGRQTIIDFFRSQYLAFGYYLEVAIRPVLEAFLFGYLSGSDPRNSPVTPLSNTLVV